MNVRSSAILFLVVCVFAAAAFGQTSPNLEAGFRPYGSYEGDFGIVNLANGGVTHHLGMPMAYPQRGGLGTIQPFIVINSKNWAVQFFPVDSSGYFRWTPSGGRNVFATVLSNPFNLEVDRARMVDTTVEGTTESDSNYFLKLPDGGTHALAFVGSSTTLFETVDGSAYRVQLQGADSYGVATSAVVIDRRGNRYQLGTFAGPVTSTHTCDSSGTCETIWNYADQGFPTTVTDANGNALNFSGSPMAANGVITDTLGRVLPWSASTSTSDYSDCAAPSAVTSAVVFGYPGPNGVTNQLKFCYANFNVATAFSASGIVQYQNVENGANTPIATPLLAAIVLPDHTKWSFNYDSYGNVTFLGLPLGGSVTYTWTEVTLPSCGSSTPVSRAVALRTENDNQGHSSTWNYTWGTVQPDATLTNAVTDPLGNDTVHVFSGLCEPHEISTLEYQGSRNSGQLLKRVDTHYQTQVVATNDGGGTTNALPDRIQTTVYPSGKVSLVTKSYDSGAGNGLPPLGDVTVEKVYDWGLGAAGALLREIDTTYLWQNDGRYLTARLLDLPASVVTKDGNGNRMAETDSTYDESQYLTASSITTQHGAAPNPSPVRGNRTTVSHWLNPGNSFLSGHTNWFDTGEVYKQIDLLGNTTTHSYDSAYAGAYSTKTSNALGQLVSGTYDFNTGLLTSFTNANATTQASGNTPGDAAHTANYAYDFMSRLTTATLPADSSGNHPQTMFNYPDALTRERLKKITASLTNDAFAYLDGLGRLVRAKHVTPSGNALVDTTYDGLDRPATVTNPYFSTSDLTYGITQSQYDGLGRLTQTTKQNGAISTISYSDNCTTTTDEAGKQRRACSDALGRLINVWEDPGGLNYETDYQYDALGNLLRVDQKGSAPTDSTKWRTRLFTYDSFSRLLTAWNPESGSISYVYDANGNLLQKIMPMPNQTGTAMHTISYCYDALNRVTGKAYSSQSCHNGQLPQGTAVVSYTYDQGTNGIGHLTSLADQAGSASYSYDILGRVSSEQRTIAGVTKTMSYTYNLDGSVASVTYPSGAVITYNPDAAGRMLSAIDIGNSIKYVTGAAYGPDNALKGFINGQSNNFGGITNTFIYNNRLQPCRMAASSTGAIPTNCTNSWGNVLDLSYDFHLGSGDNGNVYGITNYRDQTRNQTFAYDPLNRLTSAQNAGTDCSKALPDGHTEYWGNSYSYDAWGNLLHKTPTKCSAENLSLAASANNQLQGGYTYDSAGNMTHDGTANLNYSYDQENRIAGANGFLYTYDADGNRVEKSNSTAGTLYWYMSPGIVGESDLLGNLQSEYVFFDGERVARKDFPGNTVSYYFSDHLKTASVITDAVGNIKSESDYYPWGGELQFVNNDPNHYKYGGHERDNESGLDYMGARYYSNGLGRFVTPDWAAHATAVPYANFGNPQSLNLYAYVENNPTTMGDPDGHQSAGATGATGWICIPCMKSAVQLAMNPKQWGIGAGKGTGSFALHTTLMLAGPPGIIANHFIGEPKSLQATNEAQASGKSTAIVGLTAATALLPIPKGAGVAEGLADSALVVRGGVPTAVQLTKGAESIAADGTLSGVSVQSANGATVEQLSQGIPNNQIGVTTVGDVRAAGGDVVPTGTTNNPCHCDMNGVTAEQGSKLFKTQPNPSKVKTPKSGGGAD